jgi:hypothetical protein
VSSNRRIKSSLEHLNICQVENGEHLPISGGITLLKNFELFSAIVLPPVSVLSSFALTLCTLVARHQSLHQFVANKEQF